MTTTEHYLMTANGEKFGFVSAEHTTIDWNATTRRV